MTEINDLGILLKKQKNKRQIQPHLYFIKNKAQEEIIKVIAESNKI